MRILLFIALTILLIRCKKPDSYTITGTLYHHYDKMMVSYASIDYGSDGVINDSAMSIPPDGIFTFKNVPNGKHKISAFAYLGEDTITGEAQIKTGGFEEYHVDIGKLDEPGHSH